MTDETETQSQPERKPLTMAWEQWATELGATPLDTLRGRLWARLPIGVEVTESEFRAAVDGGRHATAR